MDDVGIRISHEALRRVFEDDPVRLKAIDSFSEVMASVLNHYDCTLEWGIQDLSEQGLTTESPVVIIWIGSKHTEDLRSVMHNFWVLQQQHKAEVGGITMDLRHKPEEEVTENGRPD